MKALIERYELAPEKSGQILELMRIEMAEARRRTREIVELRAGEDIEPDNVNARRRT